MFIKIRLIKLLYILFFPGILLRYLRYKSIPSIEHLSALKGLSINYIFDVGANRGQFSLLATMIFKNISIVCFEPYTRSYLILKKIFQNNNNIELNNIALGSSESKKSFFVTKNDDSSSLLFPNKAKNYFLGTDLVEVVNVDVKPGIVYLTNKSDMRNSLLKIDVQGYELEVLKGFGNKLPYFNFILIEISHVEMYDQQPLFCKVDKYIKSKNFTLFSVHNEILKNGKIIQADYLYKNYM